MPELFDLFRKLQIPEGRNRDFPPRLPLAIGRAKRTLRQNMLDVGQKEFLVLLLMIQSEDDLRDRSCEISTGTRLQHSAHSKIDMTAVGEDLIHSRPRENASRRTIV